LLRLLDPLPSCAENITIDGIPLHRVDRSILRQRIIAVSQDAVFLPDGTSIRRNLDPFEGSADEECRKVLETVGLWHFAEEQGGLSAGMSADSLSQGQKQLFSLARAILRRRNRSRQAAKAATPDHTILYEKCEDQEGVTAAIPRRAPPDGTEAGGLLLLDEVSSSVDVYTDRMMQALIKSEFANYTIVMVSHRLDMVMDFDRVLVIDQGRIVESGSPRALIEQQGGRFSELWAAGRHQVQVDSYPAIS
jgi:ABC-type multidrug transport system fused ATPase/permease subunit